MLIYFYYILLGNVNIRKKLVKKLREKNDPQLSKCPENVGVSKKCPASVGIRHVPDKETMVALECMCFLKRVKRSGAG